MSGTVIHFYFDYISPNAYLAWTQLPALAERNACADPVDSASWGNASASLQSSAVRNRTS